jgi:hypothetical protein
MDVQTDLINTLFGDVHLTPDQIRNAVAMIENDALVSRRAIARVVRNILPATIREELSAGELHGLKNRIVSALRFPIAPDKKPAAPVWGIMESSRENGLPFLRLSTERGDSTFFTCPEPKSTRTAKNGSWTDKVEPVSLSQIDARLDAADQLHELPKSVRNHIRGIWTRAVGAA